MDVFIQLVVSGLLLGGLYAVIGVGLNLIFGIVRVINFAHGELLMIGMYLTYLMAGQWGIHPYISAVPLIVLFFALGAAIQRFLIQPLLDSDPHVQIFATVGLSTALMNLALLVFGADLRSIDAPLVREGFSVGPVRVVFGQVAMFVVAVALVAGLHLFMQRTYLGRAIRATAQHRMAARLMGVNVNRVYIISFGLGAACVGLAAALLTPMYSVFPTIGTYFVLTAFVIVVLGGMGSLWGAFLGALIIGLVDSLSGYYIAPDLKEVVYFGIFLVLLVVRPTGLFGLGRGSE
ncbi:branched-chain amino acid ABC transporter permease [Azospirillum sp.]|uniref:branched-chain amino acid ABC transporter permease n=1 Tax=Azospirillum sp. TaxID=34012 RepID=UPI002D66378F|nr:branched-chain amino acid ABC transporter permease [Azospirillum sp.]HYD70282.1 branched-chain amino acid ABC transporter permease [Azospirillum sp.]